MQLPVVELQCNGILLGKLMCSTVDITHLLCKTNVIFAVRRSCIPTSLTAEHKKAPPPSSNGDLAPNVETTTKLPLIWLVVDEIVTAVLSFKFSFKFVSRTQEMEGSGTPSATHSSATGSDVFSVTFPGNAMSTTGPVKKSKHSTAVTKVDCNLLLRVR